MKLVHALSVLVAAAGLALPTVASADPLQVRDQREHAAVQHERRAQGDHDRVERRDRRDGRDRRDRRDRWERRDHGRHGRGGHDRDCHGRGGRR